MTITWTTERRKLSELVEWEKNPRQLSKHDAKALEESLRKFGLVDPLVVNLDNTLIGGHQRKHVMEFVRLFGDAEIDCRVPSRQLDETEADELGIRLNRNSGEWDWDKLVSNFDMPDLLEWGFEQADFEAQGIELEPEEPLEDPGAQVDRAEELREKWGVEPGQLWRLGEHRLICGDCTDAQVVERVMGGEKADMMFTDPPYGVSYDGGHFHSGNVNIKRAREKLAADEDAEIYSVFLPSVLPYVDGPCYMWFASTKAYEVFGALYLNNCETHAMIIWHKINATYAAMNAQYKQRHEPCIYFKPKGSTLRWCGPTDECTIWEIKRDARNEYHPTQKPVELAERAINNHEAAIVLDAFLGSGTTLIACERLGRKCRAVEISPAYVAVALDRWATMTGQTPVLIGED